MTFAKEIGFLLLSVTVPVMRPTAPAPGDPAGAAGLAPWAKTGVASASTRAADPAAATRCLLSLDMRQHPSWRTLPRGAAGGRTGPRCQSCEIMSTSFVL